GASLPLPRMSLWRRNGKSDSAIHKLSSAFYPARPLLLSGGPAGPDSAACSAGCPAILNGGGIDVAHQPRGGSGAALFCNWAAWRVAGYAGWRLRSVDLSLENPQRHADYGEHAGLSRADRRKPAGSEYRCNTRGDDHHLRACELHGPANHAGAEESA